ncbi:hypothetical protein BDW69DRAFT_178804 [Aspergillus filifer]
MGHVRDVTEVRHLHRSYTSPSPLHQQGWACFIAGPHFISFGAYDTRTLQYKCVRSNGGSVLDARTRLQRCYLGPCRSEPTLGRGRVTRDGIGKERWKFVGSCPRTISR